MISALGNLKSVYLPDGVEIEYVIDSKSRRVGKEVDGVLVQELLYQDWLNPVAELDGEGNVVGQFVYGIHVNIPEYIVKEETIYRLILDHRGSPRFVVNIATGQIIQRIDYDEFGNVTNNSNPDFHPFGFAGGLFDIDSELIRFGARDLDALTGRWLAKEPRLFLDGDTNRFLYNGGDPINWIDPLGLQPQVNLFEKEDDLWGLGQKVVPIPGEFTVVGHGLPRGDVIQAQRAEMFSKKAERFWQQLEDNKFGEEWKNYKKIYQKISE